MTETTLPPSGPGTVVLDIGADTGALILHTTADLDGREIDITPSHTPHTPRTHSQVRQRRTGATTHYAAVYPALHAGQYTLWHDPATPAATITITGGHVTEYHWPA